MPWTLLTNDDGIDSPALPIFARALARNHEIRVVAPDRERSWVGKAITRFEPLTVRDVSRDGIAIKACSGYPADAVQLGIDGIFDGGPELVVSGINLGYNHGVGFLMSSGTVGAAIEGWVSGLPAVAFSTGTATREWNAWRRWAASDAARTAWEGLAELCADLTDKLVASGIYREADLVSVNIPFESNTETPRRITTLARVGYDRLFRGVGDGTFVHDFGGGIREFGGLDGTDVAAARDGVVSITPIQLPASVEPSDDTRRALE